MADGCEVYIEGDSSSQYDGWYYIGCNQVQYIGSDGVNHSGSSITAYKSISHTGDAVDRVIFPSYSWPYYRPASGYNTYYFSVASVKFNGIGSFYRELDFVNAGTMFLITVAVILRLFRR